MGVKLFYRFLYRPLMRLAHRYNWHYAPPIYPNGDTMLWCKWCGMRDVVAKARTPPSVSLGSDKQEAVS